MLGVPAVLLGGLVTLIVRNARAHARRGRDAAASDHDDADPKEPGSENGSE